MKITKLLLILVITLGGGISLAASAATGETARLHEAQSVKHEGFGVLKDIRAEKVKIAHEPIPGLAWPAMTMWLELRGTQTKGIRVGDSVRFELQQEDGKAWVISRIERRR
ncbi:MAG TPA: copper-binding protein [Gallionella sp.]